MISDFRELFRAFYEKTGSNLVEIVVEKSVYMALGREIDKACVWDEPREGFFGVLTVDGVIVSMAR